MIKRVLRALKDKKASNGLYLIVFFVIFFVLILTALILKGINLYQSSHFKTDNYTILVSADEPHILRLDTQRNTLSILHIKEGDIDPSNVTKAGISSSVPLQASIHLKNTEIEDISSILSVSQMLRLMLQGNLVLNRINEFDLIKFVYAAARVPDDSITRKEINNYLESESDQVLAQIKGELYELFRDPNIINERVSIEVVNATSVSGLATAVGQMLENGGYNVVAIRSGDQSRSIIQTDISDSVTLYQIQQIFPYPLSGAERNSVADIRIVISNDSIEE